MKKIIVLTVALLWGNVAITQETEVNHLIRCEDGQMAGAFDLNEYLNKDKVWGTATGQKYVFITAPFKIEGITLLGREQASTRRLCVALSKVQ